MREWKVDCRHYLGDRPCRFRRECPGCDEYSPMGRRIVILKVGALGDVLRTTPILRELTAGPDPVHVTWVTGEGCAPLLRDHPRIDRVLVPGYETSEVLAVERFDLCLSLDKDPYPTALATRLRATETRGFGRNEEGSLVPLHESARHLWDLGLSDELKFRRNERTYQDLVFEASGLTWRHQEYDVPAAIVDADTRAALRAEFGCDATTPVVGFNTGAGGVFANKAWTPDGYAELARRLRAGGAQVLLLGGPDEAERNAEIARRAGAGVIATKPRPLPEFAALVAACDAVVTGDTLGMHLAIAAKLPTVVLFGSTCAQEIELYGRGEKIVTPIDCHPCYRRACDVSPNCQDLIDVDRVHAAVRRALDAQSAAT